MFNNNRLKSSTTEHKSLVVKVGSSNVTAVLYESLVNEFSLNSLSTPDLHLCLLL